MPAAALSEETPPGRPRFSVPASLLASVAASDLAEMQVWLAALPERVTDLARRWGLHLSSPFEPGGSGSWVAPARDAAGRDAVLKVGWTHTEARDEAEGLAAFGGEGGVEVYAFEHDGPTTASLLERCRPGHELRTRPEGEQHAVVTELLRRLWQVPLPVAHQFRPLSVMCEEWAEHSAARHAAHPEILDAGLVRAGLDLFRALPRTATDAVLLCTDLHASACAAARGLQRKGLTTRAGVRHHLAYLTVRSDRTDVGALVRELEPAAVPVNVEHLPRPLTGDVALVS